MTQPDGNICVTLTTDPGAGGGDADYLRVLTKNLGGAYEDCPAAPGPGPGPAPGPAVPAPVDFATQFWQNIPLPVPKPSIPPGYAITGEPAYLVTGGTVNPPAYTEATPLGVLSVTATGSYSVNWGDGNTTGPFNTEGLPYPNGTITHTYDNVGTDTVTLVEDWTATWTLAGAGGTLGELHTQAMIPNFAVRQIQAIITG